MIPSLRSITPQTVSKHSTTDNRAVRRKHMVRTLAEFEWRFNNRTHLAAMIPVLGQAAVNTCPVTYDDLKWADYGA